VTLMFVSNVDLQPLNTLAIPARARHFIAVNSESTLREVLALAAMKNLPVLILGGGSNLILKSDFDGLVIQIQLSGYQLLREDDHYKIFEVAAGENWHEWVHTSLQLQAYGLENLSLIPGTIGAAPIQNVGAYGVEVKDFIVAVRAMNVLTGELIQYTADECEFGYRDSIFKRELAGQVVITSVTFALLKHPACNLSYPALRDALTAVSPTPQQVSDMVCAIRRSRLPDPAQIPNAGSFFKNPVVSRVVYKTLREQCPDMPSFVVDDETVKIPAAWLIDRAGWKGYQRWPVAVHDAQALVLTNPGRGDGVTLLALADDIVSSVEQRYGISLDIEPAIYPAP